MLHLFKHMPDTSEIALQVDGLTQLFLENQNDKLEKELKSVALLPLSHSQRLQVEMYTGWLHHRRRQINEAIICAQSILSQTQEGYFAGKAHYLLGLCFRDQNQANDYSDEERWNLAQSEFSQAIELLDQFPERLDVIDSLATGYADNGDIGRAISLLMDAVKGQPPSDSLGYAYAALGELWMQDKDDWEQGRIYLEKAASLLDPSLKTHAWVHEYLARGYNLQQQFSKAREHGKKAVDLATEDPDVQSHIAIYSHMQYALALDKGNFDLNLAEKHYKIAINLAKNYTGTQADLYTYLGILYSRQNRDRESLKAFESALAVGKSEIESNIFYWNIATTCKRLKKFEAAAIYFQKAAELEIDNQDARCEAFFQAGYCWFCINSYKEAVPAFRSALKYINPGNSQYGDLMKYLLISETKSPH